MEENEKLLEVSIVAKRLAVSPRTVRRMIASPNSPLTGVALNEKCIRVLESTVNKAIESKIITKKMTT